MAIGTMQAHAGLCLARLLVLMGLCSLLVPVEDVEAGKLSAFESDANHVSPRRSSSSSCNHHSHSCVGDVIGEVIVQVVGYSFIYGGVSSWARVDQDWDAELIDGLAPRMIGDPGLAFARFDFGFQNVESDVDAYDYRVEGGYGPIGIHFNQTRYREAFPADELDLIRLYGLYRMSFGPYVEIDLGLGALTIDGVDRDSRFAFTMPILIHPSDYLGIEIRPAFAENISDVDVGVLATLGCTSLKVGYRWVSSPGVSLDGPYAGLSLHF